MRGVVACMLALGGCGHPDGVELEIVAPAGTSFDTVTVFVGDGSSSTVSVEPPGVAATIAGTGWQQDPPFLACGTAATAPCAPDQRFRYEVGNAASLDSVIAIATSGQDAFAAQQDDIAIPRGDLDLVRLALAPVSSTRDAQAWLPDAASGVTTPCARYQDTATSTSRYVVDLADPDCDGYATTDPRECLPDVYMGTRGPKHLPELTCAMLVPLATSEVCKLGGMSCSDGVGPDPAACAESAVCVPKSACSACNVSNGMGSPADLTCLEDMARNHVFQTYSGGRITCQPDVETGSAPMICNGTASIALALPTGAHCTKALIHDGDPASAWRTSATVTGGATVAVGVQSSCTLTIDVGSAPASLAAMDGGALVLVVLDDGRAVAIPLEILYHFLQATQQCTAAATLNCTAALASDDDLAPCLADPIPANSPFGGS